MEDKFGSEGVGPDGADLESQRIPEDIGRRRRMRSRAPGEKLLSRRT